MDSRLTKLLEEGLAEFRRGRLDAAQALFREGVLLDPTSFDALNLLGVALNQAGKAAEALAQFERALALSDNNPGLFSNLGMALRSLGRREEAVSAYDRAIALRPDFAAAHTNRGGVLMDMKRTLEALAAFDTSLEIRPDHAETHYLRGHTLAALDRRADALVALRRAVVLRPDWPEAQAALGDVLKQLKHYAEARLAYDRALKLKPDFPFLSGTILRQKTKVCDWTDYDQELGALVDKVQRNEPAMYPFASLTILSSPILQLSIARQWAATLPRPASPVVRPDRSESRIHLGYFSADFKRHPMMHLLGEVFAMHDRDRFRVTAVAFNVGQEDEYTRLARDSVDEYINVDGLSDEDVVAVSRRIGIDIAIDRKGYTRHARTAIFSRRAAPVQVNYLAYPGTMGADFIDYIIADPVIIPAASVEHYAEKVVWMPDCYSPRDTRVTVPSGLDRKAAGLPETGFVFCCFNQMMKITPGTFTEWMSILAQTEGSVLWLLDETPAASENLRREATGRGIDPARIIFAPKLPQGPHLERLRLADLGLDTLPYNAHTTANDALYVGVPFLTQPGKSFAARVCASLLAAVGLHELIANSSEEFVELAVELARNPNRLQKIRQELVAARTTSRLYDTRRYVDALESAYTTMHQRQVSGLPPDHIRVEVP